VPTFQQRVSAIIQLGNKLGSWPATQQDLFHQAYVHNNWFTPEQITNACNAWAYQLEQNRVEDFVASYQWNENPDETIAVIAAGNIPLVGLHDVICTILCGRKLLLKLSDDDTLLMKAAIAELIVALPELSELISISNDRLPKSFHKVIATGSNNTNRYFEYYFRDYPKLLRAGRNSVAVLTGEETDEQMKQLADDIFMYFGLGCRSVSKVYIPQSYDFAKLYENTHAYLHFIDHHKYANNYTYHKAILLMNQTPFLENGLLMLRESSSMASPLSMLFYEYYTNIDTLKTNLKAQQEHIQCIVSNNLHSSWVPIGKAQQPLLSDFADGIDTVQFILS
jgi:hypothetical protein